MRLETYGILITAVTLYFMKDLLVTIIQSVFKYIINPAIWSRVASDLTSSSPTGGNTENVQRVEMVSGPDLRDVNVGKALDLANQHIQLILETKKIEISQIQPSGIEMLAASVSPSTSTSSSAAATSSAAAVEENNGNDVIQFQTEPQNDNQLEDECSRSIGSSESYEEILDDAYLLELNASLISINDSPSDDMSTTTVSTEYISSIRSSDNSGTSITSDSTKPFYDSVDLISVSSDATTSSSSSATSAFRDL